DIEHDGRIQFAETDVNIRAATTGVSAAAVHLRDKFATVRQRHQRLCANRRATVQVNSRMAGPFAQRRIGIGSERQQQVQAEKRSGVRRNIVEKVRWLPLVAEREIKSSVAIHVRERDGLGDHRFGETDFAADVVVTSVGGAHEERIQILTAQVRARLEARPQSRVVNNPTVARAERLQFGPAIYFSFDEADGLDRLQHAAVVKIGEAAVPTPAAAREAKFFTGLNVRRDAVFHVVKLAGALPEKMTFGERELVRDVADVNVENPVAVDVTKVTAHAF